jgi:succinoglycan biosynthesis transport protein ExoP
MRGLYTSVRLSSPGRPPQVILIASPFPGEGKTTVATNLAIALSIHGRTCLLDADLRKSGVAEAFALTNVKGVVDLLKGTAQLDDVRVPIRQAPELTAVPTGPSTSNPGQYVTSGAMANLINTLRLEYEFVVIDSPPLLPFADARALAPLVDGVVLVGRFGSTTCEAMTRSIELLEGVHSAPILDVVLNAADIHDKNYKYYEYGIKQNAAKAS